MTIGLTEFAIAMLLGSGVSLIGLGLWRYVRGLRAAGESSDAAAPEIAGLIREGEERLSAMVAMMEAGHSARLDSLRSEISAVKADLDWLTGERMIEQAILMARDGVSAEEISADLGMSQDAAQTITAMRRH